MGWVWISAWKRTSIFYLLTYLYHLSLPLSPQDFARIWHERREAVQESNPPSAARRKLLPRGSVSSPEQVRAERNRTRRRTS